MDKDIMINCINRTGKTANHGKYPSISMLWQDLKDTFVDFALQIKDDILEELIVLKKVKGSLKTLSDFAVNIANGGLIWPHYLFI